MHGEVGCLEFEKGWNKFVSPVVTISPPLQPHGLNQGSPPALTGGHRCTSRSRHISSDTNSCCSSPDPHPVVLLSVHLQTTGNNRHVSGVGCSVLCLLSRASMKSPGAPLNCAQSAQVGAPGGNSRPWYSPIPTLARLAVADIEWVHWSGQVVCR